MQVDLWLKQAHRKLAEAGIGTARLDALVLLEDATNKDRGWLLAHPDFKLTDTKVKKLDKLIAKRSQHQPLAYIRGKTEFYGREFMINHHVLEPRPESETIIDLLKSQKPSLLKVRPFTGEENVNLRIVDVGTGSGALAITAKLELSEAEVIGVDIDENCLKVARQNAAKLQTKVDFTHGNLLQPITKNHIKTISWVILANLPYVPDDFHINPAAMNEPKIAIFGGKDGLDVYRRLFGQINQVKNKPGLILTESLPPQHQELAKIASTSGYQLAQTDDFIQVFAPARVI